MDLLDFFRRCRTRKEVFGNLDIALACPHCHSNNTYRAGTVIIIIGEASKQNRSVRDRYFCRNCTHYFVSHLTDDERVYTSKGFIKSLWWKGL